MQNRPQRTQQLTVEEFKALVAEHEQIEELIKAKAEPVVEAKIEAVKAKLVAAETEDEARAIVNELNAEVKAIVEKAEADAGIPAGLHATIHNELNTICTDAIAELRREQAQQQRAQIQQLFAMFGGGQVRVVGNDSDSDNDMDFSPSMGRM